MYIDLLQNDIILLEFTIYHMFVVNSFLQTTIKLMKEDRFNKIIISSYFGVAVRAYLDFAFSNRGIEMRRIIEWSSRSPDLNLQDFSL